MKARTFARLALLLPLLIWVILLLAGLFVYAVFAATPPSDGQYTFLSVLAILIFPYVIGIFIWLIPYLIVSVVLFLISLKSRLATLKYMFALSPFAMAILVMMEVSMMLLADVQTVMASMNLGQSFLLTAGTNLFFGVVALAWGYIFVGLGFAGYMLLQRLGMIKEEEKAITQITTLNSLEA